MTLQTHNMNPQNMILKQMQSLFNIIQALQAEVADLRASRTLTPSSSQGNSTSIATTKSEKLPDPPMFGGNRKELRPFVTKLRLKLQENADRYPTEWNKMNYAMSRLEGDATSTVDPFYRNGSLSTIASFIVLLEQTYDDASREYTAMAKLETLRQRNRDGSTTRQPSGCRRPRPGATGRGFILYRDSVPARLQA